MESVSEMMSEFVTESALGFESGLGWVWARVWTSESRMERVSGCG